MQIIVSDASCLIDLHKASLLEALIGLPYEIAIPDVMFADELLGFSEAVKSFLIDQGLKQLSLDGNSVAQVIKVREINPKLSVNDCFALILAKSQPDSILLTGDGALRKVATAQLVEVHGVLWALDQMYEAETTTPLKIVNALHLFQADITVRLPKKELNAAIRRYTELLT